MRKNIIIPLVAIAVTAIFLVIVSGNRNHLESAVTPTPSLAVSLFSDEANKIFVSSVAGDVDLNSGITMDGPTPVAIPEQINNIDFAVFNHTDEPILFSNQGFDLTVFRYDEPAKKWENLPLRYVPHSEPTILPPRLETEYSEVHNSWSILEDETTAWGYKQIRIYVSGKGQTTNKTYGAYLDVTIYLP
jgi:hypothetical protein